MNPVNGSYPRGAPQPNGDFFAQRGAGPANNGPPTPRQISQENPQQARLRQFEDDKKRLTASCCTPLPDEHKPQSYITHFRVEEDSMHQSGPPPPDASTHHKKPRVILLGVKSTGKVQMYKARENEDGTFQIGKTWDLDELQSIRVFNPATARTPEEQQQAQWAGPGGLTITMSKPYFWKALGNAEKEFFVAGLVRVFRRYTKGRAPELIGFTATERDTLLSGPSYVPPPQEGRPSSQNQAQPPPLRQQLPQQRSSSPSSSVHSSTIGLASSEPMQGPANPRPVQQQRPQPTNQPSSHRSNRDSRASSQQTPSPTSSFKAPPQAFNQSQPQQSQQPRPFEPIFPPNHQAPASLFANGGRPSNASSAVSPTFLQPLNTSSGPAGASLMSPSEISPGTHSVSSITAGRWRPEGVAATTQRSAVDSPGSEQSPGSTPAPLQQTVLQTAPHNAPQTAPQVVPERRRPPIQDASVFGSQNSFRKASIATEPSPLATQAPMQHDVSPSNMQGEPLLEVLPLRSTPQKAKAPPLQIVVQQEQERVPSPVTQAAPRQDSPSNDLPSRTTSPLDERQYRPGLGPMMGRQGSNETANKLRKAATAYSAFKPRAGGAGERLLGTKANTNDEPDGVTRVVPAPLSRNATQDTVPTLGRVASPLGNGVPRPLSPGLEKPATQTMDGVVERPLPNGSTQPAVQVNEPTEEQQMARRPSKITIPKPRRQTDFFAKSLTTMGIDTSIVNNQHVEFENILTDFNWDTNLLQVKQVDVLKTNLRRDIARLEAGSWLGDSGHKDDRVATVESLLDRAIAECDEMEGLLTLYSVELSVSKSGSSVEG